MKIAFITPEYFPHQRGGCGVSAELYVRVLRSYGIYVDVFVFDKSLPCEKTGFGNTYYYDVFPRTQLRYDFETIRQLYKLLDNYDLIHIIGEKQMFALKILQIFDHHRPIVSTLNGFSGACYNYINYVNLKCEKCTNLKLFRCVFEMKNDKRYITKAGIPANFFLYRMRQFFSKKIDHFFVLSDPIKKMYVNAGYPELKLSIVPNMIDPLYLNKLKNKSCDKNSTGLSNSLKIIYVGRLSAEKGVQDLLNSFSILTSKVNLILEIVGSGPDKESLKALAKKLCIDDKVSFRGNIEYSDIYEVYENADIFVHPGRWPEAFGRTIIEAMACGLPVICSNLGAPPIIVKDSGLIYEAGNCKELADKLSILVENDELRKSLGKKALINISKYKVENNIDNIFYLYNLILDSGYRTKVQ